MVSVTADANIESIVLKEYGDEFTHFIEWQRVYVYCTEDACRVVVYTPIAFLLGSKHIPIYTDKKSLLLHTPFNFVLYPGLAHTFSVTAFAV